MAVYSKDLVNSYILRSIQQMVWLRIILKVVIKYK